MGYLSGAWSFLTQSYVHIKPPQGYQEPPLIRAVLNRDIESARNLLEQGADTSAKDYLHLMPLHYAAMGGNMDMILLLLEYGADIAAKAYEKKNSSALSIAVASGQEATCKFLMARGAVLGPNELSPYGMLYYIRWMPDDQFKHYRDTLINPPKHPGYLSQLWTSLTQSPTRPEPPPGFKMPPLIVAVITHDIQAARDLCACGADANAKDHAGYTSLHHAAMAGDVDITSLLLDHGADITAKAGRPMKSALVLAIVNDEEGVAKVLMARGATSGRDELTEYEMASYMRWMSEDMFRDHERVILGPLGYLVDVR